jgi:hypothetical protein
MDRQKGDKTITIKQNCKTMKVLPMLMYALFLCASQTVFAQEQITSKTELFIRTAFAAKAQSYVYWEDVGTDSKSARFLVEEDTIQMVTIGMNDFMTDAFELSSEDLGINTKLNLQINHNGSEAANEVVLKLLIQLEEYDYFWDEEIRVNKMISVSPLTTGTKEVTITEVTGSSSPHPEGVYFPVSLSQTVKNGMPNDVEYYVAYESEAMIIVVAENGLCYLWYDNRQNNQKEFKIQTTGGSYEFTFDDYSITWLRISGNIDLDTTVKANDQGIQALLNPNE